MPYPSHGVLGTASLPLGLTSHALAYLLTWRGEGA